MNSPQDWSYFFDDGIRFTCTQCGDCCRGEPGAIIAVSEEELISIADAWRLDPDTFRKMFVREVDKGLSLREKENGDCIFFEEGRCSIYDVRPMQCRTYPFWLKNLRSPEAWARTCRACEGIGQGRLYDRHEIFAYMDKEMERLGLG